jgi:acyl carrier protein
MELTAVMREIKEIIYQISGIEPEDIPDDASLISEIGLSSFEITALLGALEERYHMGFSVRDYQRIVSVRDLALFISAQSGE